MGRKEEAPGELSVLRRFLLAMVCGTLALAIVPRSVAGWRADRFFEGDLGVQDPLARDVASRILASPDRHFYQTKSARFDGQSAVAIYQMAILGLGQVVLEHPEKRDEYLPAMRSAADRLVDPKTLEYAASVWGAHGVTRMAPGQGHAYLGYIDLALGMLRAVDPSTPHAKLHDRLTSELAERLDASTTGLIETYPGETWPPDVAAVAGAIGLHAQVTGTDRSALLRRWSERFSRCAIDETSGYLIQRVQSGGCRAVDAPRGSGTAVAAYFTGFADPALSHRLYSAVAGPGHQTLFGFAGIREYAPGHYGKGDVNAGPIVLGISVGATGFAIGAARSSGDRELYRQLFRTAELFGAPTGHAGGRSYAVGGALGNALLLAMLTARSK